jgi:cystathionine gamma-synthase
MHDSDARKTPASFSTAAVHAGSRRRKPYHALTMPIVQTSVFTFEDTADMVAYQTDAIRQTVSEREEYGRYGNPTQYAAERKLAQLDGGETALLFSTGMGAITTTLLTLLSTGDHMIMTGDCYRRTRQFCESFLGRFGVELTVVAPGDYGAMEGAIRDTTKVLFSESPTNPYLRVLDLPRVVDLCKRDGLLLIVDSTLATPYNQRPLEFGADLVTHSATKYLGGHNDLLAGVVVGSQGLLRQIKHSRGVMGGIVDPNTCYLLLRGLKTLGLRMERYNQTGMEVAEFLQGHPRARRVFYPGLASHPDHLIAGQQMAGFGGMVSFEVEGDLDSASEVVDALRIPYIGPSFGGPESLVEQPALQAYFELTTEQRLAVGIRDELIRYSLGLEDSSDLIADLEQALARI